MTATDTRNIDPESLDREQQRERNALVRQLERRRYQLGDFVLNHAPAFRPYLERAGVPLEADGRVDYSAQQPRGAREWAPNPAPHIQRLDESGVLDELADADGGDVKRSDRVYFESATKKVRDAEQALANFDAETKRAQEAAERASEHEAERQAEKQRQLANIRKDAVKRAKAVTPTLKASLDALEPLAEALAVRGNFNEAGGQLSDDALPAAFNEQMQRLERVLRALR